MIYYTLSVKEYMNHIMHNKIKYVLFIIRHVIEIDLISCYMQYTYMLYNAMIVVSYHVVRILKNTK